MFAVLSDSFALGGGRYSQKNWMVDGGWGMGDGGWGMGDGDVQPASQIWPKSAIFPTLFMTGPKIPYPPYDLTQFPSI